MLAQAASVPAGGEDAASSFPSSRGLITPLLSAIAASYVEVTRKEGRTGRKDLMTEEKKSFLKLEGEKEGKETEDKELTLHPPTT